MKGSAAYRCFLWATVLLHLLVPVISRHHRAGAILRPLSVADRTIDHDSASALGKPRPSGTREVTAFQQAANKKPAPPSSSLRITLLAFVVLQNSATVLVGRHTRNRPSKDEMFDINQFIIAIELSKFVISCAFEQISSEYGLMTSIRRHVIETPRETIVILVPTFLYLLQNSLQYVALSNLSAPIFQVTYQCKLITTALASVVFLGRTYSSKQWTCLMSLGLGVASVVLGEQRANSATGSKTNSNVESLPLGLISVFTACVSSALASVCLEKILKSPSSKSDNKKVRKRRTAAGSQATSAKASLWLRNIQLSFCSLCIALTRQHFLRRAGSSKPFLHGFTGWVYVLVALQAGGGILVSAVMKYADNVLKGLATGVSVILSSAGSMLIFGTPISGQFVLGASIILASVFFFSNDVPVGRSRKLQ